MRVGRTLTHHFEIETRQYDLLGIDLGEGARRRMIIFGARVADKSEYLRVAERIPVRRMAAMARGRRHPSGRPAATRWPLCGHSCPRCFALF